MIIEIKQNLFDTIKLFHPNEFIILHCISNDWALGKGIALSLENKFHIKSKKPKTSKVGECRITNFNNILIGNLITKNNYWEKPTLETLYTALSNFQDQNKYKYIIMPKIGCGLDKLKWEDVKKIIKEVIITGNIIVCIFP